MGGAPEPGLVPGCEALEWAEDRVRITGDLPQEAKLVSLQGTDVGIVFVDRDGSEPVLVSTLIEDAFGAWPPGIGETVEHIRGEPSPPPSIGLRLSSRQDGHFTVPVGSAQIVGVVGAAGTTMSLAPGPLYLEQTAGGGAYRATVSVNHGVQTQFEHLSSLSPGASTTPLGSLLTMICGGTITALALPESLLVVRGAAPSCPEPEGHVELFRIDANGLDQLASFDAPFVGTQYFLLPREGDGAWFSSANGQGIIVYPIDASGTVNGEPWLKPGRVTVGWDVSGWREGFAVARRDAGGISVLVSDGWNTTTSASFEAQIMGHSASIVGAVDGSSVLVAYSIPGGGEGGGALEIARADCVSPN